MQVKQYRAKMIKQTKRVEIIKESKSKTGE
jgi:hypothetical protein